MDEDRGVAGFYIVGVEVGDGEVVNALIMGDTVFDSGDLDVGAGAGAEPHAGFEVGGLYPLADVAGDPEGVVVGGDEHTVLRVLDSVELGLGSLRLGFSWPGEIGSVGGDGVLLRQL